MFTCLKNCSNWSKPTNPRLSSKPSDYINAKLQSLPTRPQLRPHLPSKRTALPKELSIWHYFYKKRKIRLAYGFLILYYMRSSMLRNLKAGFIVIITWSQCGNHYKSCRNELDRKYLYGLLCKKSKSLKYFLSLLCLSSLIGKYLLPASNRGFGGRVCPIPEFGLHQPYVFPWAILSSLMP